MSLEDQIRAFQHELEVLCQRYADEFNLPTEAAIGVLQFAIIQAVINSQK